MYERTFSFVLGSVTVFSSSFCILPSPTENSDLQTGLSFGKSKVCICFVHTYVCIRNVHRIANISIYTLTKNERKAESSYVNTKLYPSTFLSPIMIP